jgi:trehalose/maltose hydrolase-like predicted phosphorylase
VTPWMVEFEGVVDDGEGHREALCTLGNGVFATRGAAPESVADGVHYPGTYVAGLYNRRVSAVAGREVENEDLVNVPPSESTTVRGSSAVRTRSSGRSSSWTCAVGC